LGRRLGFRLEGLLLRKMALAAPGRFRSCQADSGGQQGDNELRTRT
jgi:hypothetical protein